jgi:hypothetical protein
MAKKKKTAQPSEIPLPADPEIAPEHVPEEPAFPGAPETIPEENPREPETPPEILK